MVNKRGRPIVNKIVVSNITLSEQNLPISDIARYTTVHNDEYSTVVDSKGLAKNSREQVNTLKGADEVARGHHLLSAKDRVNYFLCCSKIKISFN